MGSLLQDVLGLFSKKKFTQPIPYVPSKDDYFVLSTKGDSSLNVMAYLPKVEQTLISAKQFADAIVTATDTKYDFTNLDVVGPKTNLILTGTDGTIDTISLVGGTGVDIVSVGSDIEFSVAPGSYVECTGTNTSYTIPLWSQSGNCSLVDSGFVFDGIDLYTLDATRKLKVSWLTLSDGPLEASNGVGTAGQVLSSTASGVEWITNGTGDMTSWELTGDSGPAQVILNGDAALIKGGEKISTVAGAGKLCLVNHDETTRVDTVSQVSPASGGTFTVVDTITQDASGHPTAINIKTVTLPAGGTGTVTSVTSGDVNTITIGGTATDPTVSANTSAVIDGGLNLATGDQIYDFVIGLGYVESVTGDLGITMTGTPTNPIVNIDYAGLDNAILTAPTEAISSDDYVWFSDATDNSIKKTLVSNLPGGGSGVSQIVAGTNINISPAGGTGIVTINSTDEYTGTVTAVNTSNGTFVNVTGGTITNTGTITGDLSATGTPSASTYLRGDNTWATISGGDTTYNLGVPNATTNINLAGSDGTNDVVTMTGGNNITITRVSSTELSIASDYAAWVADSDEGTDISVGSGDTLMFKGGVLSGGAGIATDSAISVGEMTIGLISTGGTPDATTFYRGDGQWITPSGGSGTVTSIAQTHAGNAFNITGSPITGAGTLAIDVVGNNTQYIDGNGDLAIFPTIPQGDITDVLGGSGITVTNGGGPQATVNVDYDGTDNYIFVRTSAAAVEGDYIAFHDNTDDSVYKVRFSDSPGYYTDWKLQGDSGPVTSVDSNDTVTVAGGTAITTVVTNAPSPDTVTITLDDTAVTPGTYTYATIDVDQQGRITLASDGVAPAVTSLTTTGSSGAATLASGVLNIPIYGGGGSTYQAGEGLTLDTTTTPDTFLVDYIGVDNIIEVRSAVAAESRDYIMFSDFSDNTVYKSLIGDMPGYFPGWNATGDNQSPAVPIAVTTASPTLMYTGLITSGGAGIVTDSVVQAGKLQIGLINNGGTPSSKTYYRGDGQWAEPTGTVYTLPVATTTILGGVKIFNDTDQSIAANAVTEEINRTYGIQLNPSDQAVVNVPWTDSVYTLPLMTTTLRGGAMLGSSLTKTIDGALPDVDLRTYGVHMVEGTEQLAVYVPWDASGGGTVTSLTTTGHTTATLTGGVLNIPDSLQGFGLQTATASTGSPLTGLATNGLYLLTPRIYAGLGNIGFVPAGGTDKLFLRGDGVWAAAGSSYSLPTMTSAILGGGKLFSDVTASSVEPIAEEGNRTYGVQMNSSDQLCVNVPWVSGSGGVTGVNLAMGNSTGSPVTATIASNNLNFTSLQYMGGTNVGHVPPGGGGNSKLFLNGAGGWSAAGGGTYTGSNGVSLNGNNFEVDYVGADNVILTAPTVSVGNARDYLLLSDVLDSDAKKVQIQDITGINVGNNLNLILQNTTGQTTSLTGTMTGSNLTINSNKFGGASIVGYVPSSIASDQTTTFLRADGTWAVPAGGGGGGEVNTASNVGSGTQVFKQKTGVDLQFRTLTSADGSVLFSYPDSNTVDFAAENQNHSDSIASGKAYMKYANDGNGAAMTGNNYKIMGSSSIDGVEVYSPYNLNWTDSDIKVTNDSTKGTVTQIINVAANLSSTDWSNADVCSTTTSGSGAGLTLSVTGTYNSQSPGAVNASPNGFSIANGGSGYQVNDTISITPVGGGTPVTGTIKGVSNYQLPDLASQEGIQMPERLKIGDEIEIIWTITSSRGTGSQPFNVVLGWWDTTTMNSDPSYLKDVVSSSTFNGTAYGRTIGIGNTKVTLTSDVSGLGYIAFGVNFTTPQSGDQYNMSWTLKTTRAV